MRPLRPLRRILRQILDNRLLLLLGGTLLACQPLVPPDGILSRADLVPWMILCLSLAVFIGGQRIGEEPHPMLLPRRSGLGALFLRLSAALVPPGLFAFYETGRDPKWQTLVAALGVTTLMYAFRGLGTEHGRTAWDPERGPGASQAAIKGLLFASASLVAGHVSSYDGLLRWVGPGLLLGTSFLAAGQVYSRTVHFRQRAAAGRTDGKAWRPDSFRPALALLGPGAGLWLLFQLYERLYGPAGFEQAYIVALHVVAWAAVLHAPQPPVAVMCMLHELVPTGGADADTEGTARGFDEQPEGALRLNPLRLKRAQALHLWLVPVQNPRIGDLDDPVRPLWERAPAPLPSHVLGEAVFEPDPATLDVQTELITVRLRGQMDTATLGGGEVQSRRIAVMRAFPHEPWLTRRETATWRWETALPRGALQVVDATTQVLKLRDGDVIVLSTEGVARAYELEVGAPVREGSDLPLFRVPCVEDYASV